MSLTEQTRVRTWMDHGTKLFLSAVDGLDDGDFPAETTLPGWSRAHVVAHVHYNAKALLRLLHWARTGEPTPMYASAEQRNSEIDQGATLPPAALRTLVRSSAEELDTAIDTHPEDAWNHEVVTAQGRTVPAREVLWMRTREVAVHAIDLNTGIGFADLHDDLNNALLADVIQKRAGKGEGGTLAAWLTGRAPEPPPLQPWL